MKSNGIVPQVTDGYTVEDISAAIEKTLEVTPYIQCYETKEEGKHVFHLLTIELCFNPSFKLISCSTRSINYDDTNNEDHVLDGDKHGATVKCPSNTPIIYTDNFPKLRGQQQQEL